MLVEGRVAERQVVPASAVVREGNVDFVYVETRPGVLRMTPVDIGPERDGVHALLKPLQPGARVAIDGAFHANNVRAQRALAAK